MGMAIKIKTVLWEKKMTIKELAEKIGANGNNLSNKLSRDNFTEKDLHEIAKACGVSYEGYFILEDGRKI